MASENNKIGLIPATLMVAGNMMGSGVFMLPANLAAIGIGRTMKLATIQIGIPNIAFLATLTAAAI